MKLGRSLKADLALMAALYAAILMAIMPAVSGAVPEIVVICSTSKPGGGEIPADDDRNQTLFSVGHCAGMSASLCGPVPSRQTPSRDTIPVAALPGLRAPPAIIAPIRCVARGPPEMVG